MRSTANDGGWVDIGGFANVCADPDPGYSFRNLTPSTTYVLSIRAYHLVDGVKIYSPAVSITGTTLDPSAPPTT